MDSMYKVIKSVDYSIEKVLPILTLLIHDYKKDDYYLRENQDYLISCYNLYNCIIYLSNGDRVKNGILNGNIFDLLILKGEI